MSEIFVLSEREFEGAKNLPVIVFEYFEKEIDLGGYDALIFTSKNGVAALDNICTNWREFPVYSIGSATSSEVKKRGAKIAYEARSSYGDNFAGEIKKRLENKRVLFPRAKVVTSSLNSILKNAGVRLDELIVYETKCNNCKNLTPPAKNSYIIFSSPSTISCFFKCFEWDETFTAVVIGEKTASHMPRNIKYILSEKQTISSCISLAKENMSKKIKN